VSRDLLIGAALAASVTFTACYDFDSFDRCTDGISPGCQDAAIDATQDAAVDPYRRAVLADRPIAYWRLDETSGTVAADSSGSHVGRYEHGVSLGAPGALDAPDAAARFDGIDDDVWVADAEDLRLDGSFSIEFWARADPDPNTTTFPGILGKGGGNGYFIWYDDRLRPVLNRAAIDGPITTGGALSTDAFTHYVVTYDALASLVTWYVDGAEDSTQPDRSYPPSTDTSPLRLAVADADQYGREILDEIALYDHALSIERIQAHHAAR
jgi:hypothetical protein